MRPDAKSKALVSLPLATDLKCGGGAAGLCSSARTEASSAWAESFAMKLRARETFVGASRAAAAFPSLLRQTRPCWEASNHAASRRTWRADID